MSFISALLLLNMDDYEAFCCFCNILSRPFHTILFEMNPIQMKKYFHSFILLFGEFLPDLYLHFQNLNIQVELFLIDWYF